MRTEAEIIADMDATLATLDVASKPTSTNEVGFFVWLKKAWSLFVQDIERRVDALLLEVQAAVDSRPVGSLAWYVEQIKAFQLGDAVGVFGGGAVGYAVIDPAKQIVVQASCSEDGNGRLLIKVAKSGGVGLLAALADTELSALRAYVQAVKFAGVGIDVVSRSADELRLSATVKIDRQVLSASGISLADNATKPIEVAVLAYLRSLPFNGVLSWTGLTDYMQGVPGVLDFVVTATGTRAAGGATFVPFDREVSAYAGHLILSPETTFTYVS